MCDDYKDELKHLMNAELSSYYKYEKCGNVLYLTIKKVTANMQYNCGAFDSWAVAIKHRMDIFKKIILRWQRAEDITDYDYQRFLYRVDKATKVYEWLEVDKECKCLLDDLLIKHGNMYVVNVPGDEAKENANRPEAKTERMFVKYSNEILASAAEIDNTVLYNQLPVGLFKDEVIAKNRIWKGALDIWGLSTNRNNNEKELHIFELKEPDAKLMMGIYSELFFYAMFEKDIIDGNFKYKDIDKIKNFRGICNLINSDCKSIKAHFLATKLHPLIDQELISKINDVLKSWNIQFDFIKYEDIKCKKEF